MLACNRLERGPKVAATVNTKLFETRLKQEYEELTRDIDRLEQLTEQLGSGRGDEDRGVGNHMAEAASSTFDQERNLALLKNLRRTLEEVEAARSRIIQGTYGLCERCDRPIDRARLEALPYARYCVDCQFRIEGL